MQRIQERGRTSLVIRNQPHGSVSVKSVGRLKRQVALVFPDGKVRSVPDPNDDIFTNFDARLVLEEKASAHPLAVWWWEIKP